jgi:hypothetical protein
MEPHELIFAVTNAGVAARCLQVVAELGVADHIDDHPGPREGTGEAMRGRPGRAEPGASPAGRARCVLGRRRRVPAQHRISAAAQRQPDVDARLSPDDGPAGDAAVVRRPGPLSPCRSPVDRAERSRRLVGIPAGGAQGARDLRTSHDRESGRRNRGSPGGVRFLVLSPDRGCWRRPRPPAARDSRGDAPGTRHPGRPAWGSRGRRDRRIPGSSGRRATSSSTRCRPRIPIWSWT